MKYFSALSRIPAILHFANAPLYIFLHILCTCLNHFRSAVLLVIFLNLFLQMVNMQASLVSVFTLLGIYILLLSGIGTFSVWFENYYKPTICHRYRKNFVTCCFSVPLLPILRILTSLTFIMNTSGPSPSQILSFPER